MAGFFRWNDVDVLFTFNFDLDRKLTLFFKVIKYFSWNDVDLFLIFTVTLN